MKQLCGLLFTILFGLSLCKVQQWTDDDFISNLKSSGVAFVKFFAPWCGHCKRLAPTWESLSEKMDPKVPIVEVDCTASGKATCGDYDVRGYPTIIFIKYRGSGSSKSNEAIPYDGQRDVDSMIAFCNRETRPAITELKLDEIDAAVTVGDSHVFLAVVKSESSALLSALKLAASAYKGFANIYYTLDKKAFDKFKLNSVETIIALRPKLYQGRNDPERATLTDNTRVEEFFKSFIVGQIGFRKVAWESLYKSKNLIVFIDNSLKTDVSRFKMTRTHLYGIESSYSDVSFSIAASDEYAPIVKELGLEAFAGKYIVSYRNENNEFFLMDKPILYSELKTLKDQINDFVQDVMSGKISKYVKSEPIPDEGDTTGRVATVVGKTFDEIVGDEEKDVLVAIIASWCGHCKKLKPILDEVAEKLKGETKIKIAKIDGTANSIPPEYSFTGFPTVYFAKIGAKKSPISYDGARTADAIITWLGEHTTFPLSGKDEL